ncbi:hypothetical protein [Plesiomonas shigelloides]|uniref:hypothetical protein n=1 Tax=Plesiomonas shigelloides TaxID=703 RepID=UPI00126249BB|nr:hypothetical protein [Plesiomonas shigelloides]KAB7689055.1 hypothetical protein GBN20_08000 [Plesiomonas shigelloides]
MTRPFSFNCAKKTDFVRLKTMRAAGKNTIYQLQQVMLCQNYRLQQNQLTGKKTGLHSPTLAKLQRAHSPTMLKNGKNAEVQ